MTVIDLDWRSRMKLEVFDDADSVARSGCGDNCRRCSCGDRCPWPLCPGRQRRPHSRGSCCGRWQRKISPGRVCMIYQVDERVAPAGDPDRNLTHLRESLLQHAPLRREQIHAMPVESTDLRGRSHSVRLGSSGDRRITASARPRPPRSWARRPYRLAGAWRCCARCHRSKTWP